MSKNKLDKIFDTVETLEDFAFYGVVGAAFGIGTFWAVSRIVADKISPTRKERRYDQAKHW